MTVSFSMTTDGAVILRYAAMGIKGIESVALVWRLQPLPRHPVRVSHSFPGRKIAAIDH
jgi:hypothetical protein